MSCREMLEFRNGIQNLIESMIGIFYRMTDDYKSSYLKEIECQSRYANRPFRAFWSMSLVSANVSLQYGSFNGMDTYSRWKLYSVRKWAPICVYA